MADMEEDFEFTGCLSCLNDGYSARVNYLIGTLTACLVVVGIVISQKTSVLLGIPLVFLAVAFAGSWFAFDRVNR